MDFVVQVLLAALCLASLLLFAAPLGLWLLYRRTSCLQERLARLEYRLGQLELGAFAPLDASTQAAPPKARTVPGVVQPDPTPSIHHSKPEPGQLEKLAPLETHFVNPPTTLPPTTLPPTTLPPTTLPPTTLPPATPASAPSTFSGVALRKPLLIDWFLRMHLLVQIGLVLLFIGIALLLRYAIDQGWLSVEMRHFAAVVGGMLLSGIGFAVRNRRPAYGLALQGGGLAVLYLTAFSAYQFYGLLPAALAFGLFVMLSAIGVALSLWQNARILAYAALTGAFAAPLLVASEGGSPIGLFGYYLVLALTAFGLALHKGWQGLVILALLFTHGVGAIYTAANPETLRFAPTDGDYLGLQGFVILFFGLFAAAGLLFAQRNAAQRRIGDLAIAVLNPLLALIWQLSLVQAFDRGAGYSLAAGSAVYLTLFAALLRRNEEKLAPHRELSLFWALFMLTVAVPVFFEAQITAPIWAVAGAIWVWLAQRRSVRWLAPWGLLTQLVAGVAFLPKTAEMLERLFTPLGGQVLFLNDFMLGWAMLGLAGLASSRFLTQEPFRSDNRALWKTLAALAFVWGLGWWYGGGLLEATMAPNRFVVSTIVLFLTISTTTMALAGRRLAFSWLEMPGWMLSPALLLFAFLHPYEIDSPLQGAAWLAWPLALVAHFGLLRLNQGRPGLTFHHAAGVWLIAYLVAAGVNGLLRQVGAEETVALSAVLGSLALLIAGTTKFVGRMPAPIGSCSRAYRLWGLGPVVAAGSLLLLWANLTLEGGVRWLPFLPLLNPLGLADAALLAAVILWLFVVRNDVNGVWRRWIWSARWAWWALAIFCMSAELARSAHHLLGTPFTWDGLYASAIYQTLLAVLWSVTALGLMMWGNRRRSRSAWFAGAAVLGLTVVKLFVVDLANVGAVARIVSFIGVGALILLIAFLAPAPPRREGNDLEAQEMHPPLPS
ncbi:MAG: DUF2339 domain-containing protein [Caldilinea sp.]|nr:DUF2339 domain-containing protein [Caldilinea sp.]MDW8442153.1 DUF2339 domain-containing protein [Caldilineaceae bacterium]